jgi:hypothetical protein
MLGTKWYKNGELSEIEEDSFECECEHEYEMKSKFMIDRNRLPDLPPTYMEMYIECKKCGKILDKNEIKFKNSNNTD